MSENGKTKATVVWTVFLENFKGNTFYKSSFYVDAAGRRYLFNANNKRLLIIRMIGTILGSELPENDADAYHAGTFSQIWGDAVYTLDADVPLSMIQLIEYLSRANVSVTKKQLEPLKTYEDFEDYVKAYLPLMGNRLASR